ncbi:Methionine aminopeptidase 1 [Hondaea fermentalgiana]|uniref:Methionine aminopeptidase n=1 Tax=Hondaea fermentalgiana TaxID=2315210 RepID=A0A2R5H128_9STRA|nr:Methionine aminopeptidase 1 [Hondaea fermentalgiana]|eukprot:GBG34783.1 Methionine aminopeptidase 1 [Hondaea fermentalgiana]
MNDFEDHHGHHGEENKDQDQDSGEKQRRQVVFHMDLDAFYAQVEHRRLGIPRDVPVGVQQWGGIIARNYPMRDLGIPKGMLAHEVKASFPQVQLVHVEVLELDPEAKAAQQRTGRRNARYDGEDASQGRNDAKASLRRYRQASFEVMDVIRKHVPLRFVERASIDEAYLDVTDLVKPGSSLQLDDAEVDAAITRTVILGDRHELGPEDADLRRGAALMERIRRDVLETTQFTMSGGIATNKILAKIASAHNKPAKQTVVPRDYGPALVRSIPLSKVPGLAAVGAGTARWVLGVAAAVDNRPVKPKMAPKSLLSAKSFTPIADERPVRAWLRLLVAELFFRAHADAVMFGRIATKLTLHYASRGGGFTRRLTVPKPNPFLKFALLKQDKADAAQVADIESRGTTEIVDACYAILKPLPFVNRLGLALDTFESISIPGSWLADASATWQTQQQQRFQRFFAQKQSSSNKSSLRQTRRFLGSGQLLKKGNVSKRLSVPKHIMRPPYAETGIDPLSGKTYSVFELGSEELAKMKDACKHTGEVLAYAGSLVKPGVTTDEIDRKVHEFIIKKDIYPSPLGYRDFPKSLCSSINEVICHGIPDDRELIEGDIVNLDVSCYADGFHGDTSRTFRVGNVSEAADKLVSLSDSILKECIEAVGPNVPLNTVGKLVSRRCEEEGIDTSRTFCGHGISSTFHCLPYVLHFDNDEALVLPPGMVLTIEPALCEGKQNHILWEDGWTVATADGGYSAQAEHTILITDHGAEILT